MSPPQMIATDLDGTLLGPDGQISQRTRAAVHRAVDAGIIVMAATGRSRHSALPKLDDVEGIRWVVCSNGAMVWDRDNDELHLHRPIAGPVAKHVVAQLRAVVDEVAIGWETPHGFGFDHRFADRPPTIDEYALRTQVPEPNGHTEVTKFVISMLGIEGAENMESAFRPHLPTSVTGAVSGNSFMEVTASGVNKASSLAFLAERLGVLPRNVAAFGDQHNDLAMIRWAGTGFAMANGQRSVLEAADGHAPSNADDGVAQTIERWLG